ncbi:MAG: cyclic pyranopterin monophosphate synthase MoaC [Phycisphaeraceae bacterium]|nr:cyclic pyranopterin monophosphate synthase MoaC [Phycisphaeraceae bacterium]
MKKLTHVDDQSRPRMVDVTDKPISYRVARVQGHIDLQGETIELIQQNGIQKGNVLTVAELAGVQAAKQTPQLIPLCHTLLLSRVQVDAVLNERGVTVTSEAKCSGQTGVEMEALCAVSVALLTVYDMCKAVDKRMCIGTIRLLEKTKTSPLTEKDK